jgi:hypothetical protein
MVAQPVASMAAGSSSGEESAAGTGPAPAEEIQEQATSPMEAMLAHILQEVGSVRVDVQQINVRTEALEGAMVDASMSSGEELQTGRGSESVVTMVTTSLDRWKGAP